MSSLPLSPAELFDLTGRNALVTGGSVSIGRAIALQLAAAGADVAIQYSQAADARFRYPDAAARTCAEIAGLSRRAVAIAADFAKPGEASRCVAEASAQLGRLEILVICASIQSRQAFEALPADEIARHVAINFTATVELLQAALPAMAERGWGRVLSIGSVNQTRPDAELSVYAALKSAQHNLIINLARRYADKGVTLNTLSPGLVATERNRWRRKSAAQWRAIEQAANPMRRAGQPQDMVGAALLLCSQASSFITGADLQVTGGGHL
ncbi:NAD(P)-dependent dehydrogenase, short-chain alcohol dehydrogenase family [Rhizobiales bacterium GAS113]|nr:NAD(P)-dependent dehydrogenase, short-chain alcohol dehydrogenase family [Rhizobiales bacterium GAS113]